MQDIRGVSYFLFVPITMLTNPGQVTNVLPRNGNVDVRVSLDLVLVRIAIAPSVTVSNPAVHNLLWEMTLGKRRWLYTVPSRSMLVGVFPFSTQL